MNSANISASDRTDEHQFPDPKFFSGSVGVVDIWWIETAKKHTFGAYIFHRVCIKTFPISCTQDTGSSAVFGCGSSVVRNFRNFSEQQSPLSQGRI